LGQRDKAFGRQFEMQGELAFQMLYFYMLYFYMLYIYSKPLNLGFA
jgi:hypothetical protein